MKMYLDRDDGDEKGTLMDCGLGWMRREGAKVGQQKKVAFS